MPVLLASLLDRTRLEEFPISINHDQLENCSQECFPYSAFSMNACCTARCNVSWYLCGCMCVCIWAGLVAIYLRPTCRSPVHLLASSHQFPCSCAPRLWRNTQHVEPARCCQRYGGRGWGLKENYSSCATCLCRCKLLWIWYTRAPSRSGQDTSQVR